MLKNCYKNIKLLEKNNLKNVLKAYFCVFSFCFLGRFPNTIYHYLTSPYLRGFPTHSWQK